MTISGDVQKIIHSDSDGDSVEFRPNGSGEIDEPHELRASQGDAVDAVVYFTAAAARAFAKGILAAIDPEPAEATPAPAYELVTLGCPYSGSRRCFGVRQVATGLVVDCNFRFIAERHLREVSAGEALIDDYREVLNPRDVEPVTEVQIPEIDGVPTPYPAKAVEPAPRYSVTEWKPGRFGVLDSEDGSVARFGAASRGEVDALWVEPLNAGRVGRHGLVWTPAAAEPEPEPVPAVVAPASVPFSDRLKDLVEEARSKLFFDADSIDAIHRLEKARLAFSELGE